MWFLQWTTSLGMNFHNQKFWDVTWDVKFTATFIIYS
jgi:hypothetical protein